MGVGSEVEIDIAEHHFRSRSIAARIVAIQSWMYKPQATHSCTQNKPTTATPRSIILKDNSQVGSITTRLPPLLIPPVADDKSQITALLHRYGAVLASHSLPEVLSIYTRDGVIMAPGFAPACGQDALKAAYERIFSTIKLEIEFEIDEIVVTGEGWAFARTTAEGTKFWLKRGTEEEHRNQELFVLRKEGREGVDEWRIARYCFSSMKPIV